MTERRASRRDLFRLLGGSVAGAAGRVVPEPPAPAAEAPVEGGRIVVDLSLHPVPPGKDRRFAAAGLAGTVLLARVPPDHFAAVTGDCPHCGGPLRFDEARDAVLCPRGGAAFRLDGTALEGPRDLRLRVHLCRRAGPRVEIEVLPA